MNMEAFTESFFAILRQNGLDIYATKELAVRFCDLTRLLLDANKQMNLTAIRDERAVISLHYADCLAALRYIPEGSHLLDIGCGAGFPTLPFALARPDLSITAMDSTAKKIGFVSNTARELGLTNVSAVCARAEEAAQDVRLRERFDVCTARAVAELRVLSELCVPFVRVGGLFLAMKGSKGDEEFAQAGFALEKLGCTAPRLERCTLQTAQDPEQRTFLLATKTRPTPPTYPRKYAQIVKKPL